MDLTALNSSFEATLANFPAINFERTYVGIGNAIHHLYVSALNLKYLKLDNQDRHAAGTYMGASVCHEHLPGEVVWDCLLALLLNEKQIPKSVSISSNMCRSHFCSRHLQLDGY